MDTNILHYVSYFSLPSETFIYDLITNLDSSININNHVVCHHRQLEEERPFDKTILVDSHSYWNRFEKKILGTKEQTIYARKIKRIINRENIDLVHSHFGPNGIRMQELLKTMGKSEMPHVISFHGMDINRLPKEDEEYKTKLLNLNHCHTFFFAPSNFLKTKMLKLGLHEPKTEVIPNAVNDMFFNKQQGKTISENGALKLINVGRFVPVKGQKYLILAVKQLIKTIPDISLTIVGYGSMEEELKNLTNQHKLDDHIIFPGKVGHNKIPSLLQDHDIYVHSSVKTKEQEEESFGLAVIEALASGLPVVSTNTGGTKEIIEKTEAGVLVEPKSPNAIKSAVELLYINTALYNELKTNARENAMRLYNHQSIKNNWINRYHDIIKKL